MTEPDAAPETTGSTAVRYVLDRHAYAEARARGASMAEAARMAGHKSKATAARANAGRRLESEPEVLVLIQEARDRIAAEAERRWETAWPVAQREILRILEDPGANPTHKLKAAELVARICGKYAPSALEVTTNAPPLDRDFLRTLLSDETAAKNALDHLEVIAGGKRAVAS